VRLSPLGTAPLFGLFYQLHMIDYDNDEDYAAIGGMRIGRGNRSTRRKPTPVLIDLTWVAAVGSRRLWSY
jgi:hypothetical protein